MVRVDTNDCVGGKTIIYPLARVEANQYTPKISASDYLRSARESFRERHWNHAMWQIWRFIRSPKFHVSEVCRQRPIGQTLEIYR